jgi:hypothetical protein
VRRNKTPLRKRCRDEDADDGGLDSILGSRSSGFGAKEGGGLADYRTHLKLRSVTAAMKNSLYSELTR